MKRLILFFAPLFLLCIAGNAALAQSSPGQPLNQITAGHGISLALTIIAGIFGLGLGIYALITFFEIKEPGDPQFRVARNAALLMLLFEVAVLFFRTTPLTGNGVALLVVGDAIYFIKLIIAIYVGIHLWQRAGKDYWGLSMWKTDRVKMLSISLAAIGAAVLYSIVLFSIFHPTAGWAVKSLSTGFKLSGVRQTSLSLIILANFAFGEEFLYRGCLQPIFARMCRGAGPDSWKAIVGIALLWTLGHTGSLSPDWVKYLQMFPLGLFLGWWYGRAGYLGSLLVHLGFNIILALISGHLIQA
jgi:membrane protease YdiL (CAAX protease family)